MIYRNNHHRNYTVLSNELLQGGSNATKREDGLNLESVAVLVHLLSHPTDWQVTNASIAQFWGISRERVSRITKALEAAGYIQRNIKRDDDGKVKQWDYDVTDTAGHFTRCNQTQMWQNPDLDIETQRKEYSLQSNKKTTKKKTALADAIKQCPKGIPVQAFDRWLRHKADSDGILGAKLLNNAIRTFELLHKARCTNYEVVVDIAINKGWRSIDPQYALIKNYFSDDRDIKMLMGVK